MSAQGQVFVGGKVRRMQTPLYDSFAVATTTTLTATGTIKMFNNISGVNSVGPETTNMQKAFELPAGSGFLVRSMRLMLHAAAADITSFCKNFTVRLIAGGIPVLDAPPDYWPGGGGVSTAASNGLNDPGAIVGFDLDPIDLTGLTFRVEIVGTTFTTTAAFFCRCYLDGRRTDPM